MNDQRHANDVRILELLADQATVGLSDDERSELERLIDGEDATYEQLAAALNIGLLDDDAAPMPKHLEELVMAECRAFCEGVSTASSLRMPEDIEPAHPPLDPGTTRLGMLAPWLMAAAALVVAAVGWWPSPQQPAQPPTPPIVDRLAAASDEIVVPWADNETGVTGEIHWSNELQSGYMRLSGLSPNLPDEIQYQLWIFDAQRNPDFNAVDGGVFDITRSEGDVIVPIDAKLQVFDPQLFAITTEPPGGVVKHDPTRDPDKYKIILTAPVS